MIQNGSSQDFDLNLAPIIDCFTVLIAFMLASASFLAIGVFDVSVGLTGEIKKEKSDTFVGELKIGKNSDLQFLLSSASGKTVIKKRFPSVSGKGDFHGLSEVITSLTKRYKGLSSVTITPSSNTSYEDVVRAMEVSRKGFPTISIGGLE